MRWKTLTGLKWPVISGSPRSITVAALMVREIAREGLPLNGAALE
jgi:hypothetical protein